MEPLLMALPEVRSVRRFLLCFPLGALLACVCLAQQVERIPLAKGGTTRCEVLEVRASGLYVRTQYGKMLVPWSRIHPSYKRHPDYTGPGSGGAAPPDEGAEESEDAEGTGFEDDETGEAAAEAEGVPLDLDPVAVGLGVAFLLFWANILSVWLVSHEELVGGRAMQRWNMAALILGLPVAMVFLIRHKGVRGMFGFTPKTRVGADGSAEAIVCLFTWDGQPVKPGVGKRASTGLIVAQAILGRAAKANASDVHFDTTSVGVEIRLRVDGVLREGEMLSADSGKRVMAAIKMASGLDVAKQHEAQDGACHLAVDSVWYDLRIARAWAVNGETVVVRLLKSTGQGSKLTDFGMTQQMDGLLSEIIQDTAGIVILAGPTGSGKTTTIYALLRMIVGRGRNILTIEDPVEYRLDGATQISLNERAGSTFASALKASMRHDPDVILVGEIRDAATMNVAFQASLTGHLVFTTIHASSVLATFGRLNELGISAYLMNTGLKAIICQRLVRKLCPTCREPYIPEVSELSFWGFTQESAAGRCFYRAVGCELCGDTGYHGRTGVHRVMPMNNKVRQRYTDDVSVGDLQEVIEEFALGNAADTADRLLWTGETASDELRKTLDMFDFGKRLWNVEDAGGTPELAQPPPDVRPLPPQAQVPHPETGQEEQP